MTQTNSSKTHNAQQADWTRRRFLGDTAVMAGSTLLATSVGLNRVAYASANFKRPKVAALFSHFTEGSHSELILENFLEPYMFNGELIKSPCDVVSFYIDKFPRKDDDNGSEQGVGMGADDIGREVAKKYGIPLYSTITEAMRLGSTELAVDAVLMIGEYGYRSVSALSDRDFPRRRFMKEVVEVLSKSNRVVPVFNDKNFTYRWDWAKEMFESARTAGIPLMAGSSVPLAHRRPALDLPLGSPIEEIVAIHGGDLEGYDYHGVEILQSLAEGRKGGETGISRVQQLSGESIWKAADEGRWSVSLAQAALEANFAGRPLPIRELVNNVPRAILVDYTDGTRGSVLSFGGAGFCAACKLKGERNARGTSLYGGPWGSRGLFQALAHAIQEFFVNKVSPYPVERTLMTGGTLDAAMHSHQKGGEPVHTPHLQFAYPSVDWSAMRENGRTWELVPSDAPSPAGLLKATADKSKAPGK